MKNDGNAAAMNGDNLLTWFERIKACQTPEDMAGLLDRDGRSFCPSANCIGSHCRECVIAWLSEEV